MCRRILLSLWTLAAAVGAYFFRAAQLSLPRSSNIYCIGLWSLLGATLLLSILLTLPEKEGWTLSALHSVPVGISLLGSGALLITASAAWQLYQLYPTLPSFAAINAGALLLGGLGLFGGMAACCRQEINAGGFLLLPLCAAALQLMAAYQETGSDPHLWRYDMRILFLAAAAISTALLTDFVFANGKRRLTLVSLSLTVTFAGASLPSIDSLPRLLALMGTAFTALGYLLVLLHGFEHRRAVTYELVDDPFSTGRVRTTPPVKQEGTPSQDSSPAPPSAEAPSATDPTESSDAFDLSRVDRLLLELELEDEGKHIHR